MANILIADDDKDIIRMLRFYLEKEGFAGAGVDFRFTKPMMGIWHLWSYRIMGLMLPLLIL